jgi:hypothetical protein
MASHAMPVVSCLLPGIGKHSVCLRRPLSVKVELQHLDLFQKLLVHENGGKFSAVIRAAWALLLRSYTGLDEVVFGFEETGNSPSMVAQENAVDCEVLIPALLMQLRGDMSFGQLLEHAEKVETILTTTSDDTYQYNSSVSLRFGVNAIVSSKNQLPSKTRIMSEKVSCLHHLISNICLIVSLV